MRDIATILLLCAAVLCATAGALVWRHVTIASGVLILAGILAVAAGWFVRDTDASSASSIATRGTSGVWSPRAMAILARASRLRDSDAPVSHARTIDRLSRTVSSESEAS